MKLLFLLSFMCILCNANPLLVVVLMVKNEEQAIRETLEPFVKAGLQNYLIFDTGSDDNTIAVTKEYFAQNNVSHGYIAQEEFVDFATSRNRALELANQKFPDAIFMLMPDAEWYMHNVEALVAFCQQEQFSTTTSYLVHIMSTALDFYTPRLIRCNRGIAFAGAVHEVLMPASNAKVSVEAYFELKPSHFGVEKSKKRWHRDKKILLRELEKNPNDSRTAFYLAQTFECLGELEKAYEYYLYRSKLIGWPEEDFMTMYRLAQVTEALSKNEITKENYPWSLAKEYYLKAFAMRSCRAEPLIKMANYYWETQQYEKCYDIAKTACDLVYPKSDILFVEKYSYECTRFDLLGRGAYYTNEWLIGVQATLKAIRAAPIMGHLHYNIVCFINQKRSNYHLRQL